MQNKKIVLYSDPKVGLGENAFLALLEDELHRLGVHIVPSYKYLIYERLALGQGRAIFVFHLHFPDWVIQNSKILTFKKAIMLTFQLLLALLLNIKIVRTVHDFGPLHTSNDKLNHFLQKFIYNLASKCIFLSRSSRDRYFEIFRIQKDRSEKNIAIPLPGYGCHYPNRITKDQARNILNIKPDKFVVLLFGSLKPYKHAIETTALFHRLLSTNLVLLIVGRPHPIFFDHKSFFKAVDNDPRILCIPKSIPVDEVQIYLNASDILLLPYQTEQTCGSGVLMLAFDFKIPVLARRNSYCNDLLKGSENILFETDEELCDILKTIQDRDLNSAKKFMLDEAVKYSPSVIAKRYLEEIYGNL